MLCGEGTIETNLYKADLLAVCVEIIDGFFYCIANRAHCDDDSVSVGRAVVVKELVVCALFVNLLVFLCCGYNIVIC